MSWHLLPFKDLDLKDLYQILQIRSAVFVVEQQCSYQDLDNRDFESFHLFYKNENDIIAYCRILPPGMSYQQSSIGRVLTISSHRKQGLGKSLMQQAIQHTLDLWPKHDIVISAQVYLDAFYKNLGFKLAGNPYLEDDIPHVKMIFEKSLW
ncbi:MAG TPA: GNAT family N-acetyltransferase [Edaphocola sp.]|nr:GNAT family N-acetyltransferase [Edaphocola sp.]